MKKTLLVLSMSLCSVLSKAQVHIIKLPLQLQNVNAATPADSILTMGSDGIVTFMKKSALNGGSAGKAPLNGLGTSGTWPISVTGNAGSATIWGRHTADFTVDANVIYGFPAFDLSASEFRMATRASAQSFLDINNASTLNNSISGYSENTRKWEGQNYGKSPIGQVTGIMAYGAGNYNKVTSPELIGSWMGLGPNAYTSTEYAPINSPAFTGIPTVPTAIPATNTNQVASTAFVEDAVLTFKRTFNQGMYTPKITGVANYVSSTFNRSFFNSRNNFVTITGTVTVVPAAGDTLTQLRFSLPLSSRFTGEFDVIGVMGGYGITGRIYADSDADEGVLMFKAVDTNPVIIQYTATYQLR